jgi:hypothetical protein
MAIITTVTPSVLRDLFLLLGHDDQGAFLRLLAGHLTAGAQFTMLNELPRTELKRFTDMIHEELLGSLFFHMMGQAIEIVRDNPAASTAEAVEELNRRMRQTHEQYDRVLHDLEAAKLKQVRDRKPDPERDKIAGELSRLKVRMSWSKLTKHVMDNHPEWVEATWPKGSPKTPKTVKSVYEYIRKIYRDYQKTARL